MAGFPREVLLGVDVGLAISLFHMYLRLRRERQRPLLFSAMRPASGAPRGARSFILTVPPRLGGDGRLRPLGEVLRHGLLLFSAYNALLAVCILAGCI